MRSFFPHVPRTEARAALSSLTAAGVLLVLKFSAYFLTNSSAIFSDALESIVNVAAAGFAIYSLDLAHRPADKEHPYGHGKVEFLSAGFEGSMILLAALVAIVRAIDAMRHIELRVHELGVGVGLLAMAICVNAIVGVGLLRVGRKSSSATLEADGHHLLSDAITDIAAITGLLVVHFSGWKLADPIAGIIVALYIGRTGIKLMRRAVGGLMDEQDQKDEKLLHSLLDSHVGPGGLAPQICSYHKLRHRHSGRYHWVDFHIVVPSRWDVRRGHEVASALEHEIELALSEGDATAHIEPCNDLPCPCCDADSNRGASAAG